RCSLRRLPDSGYSRGQTIEDLSVPVFWEVASLLLLLLISEDGEPLTVNVVSSAFSGSFPAQRTLRPGVVFASLAS
ncbi:hypothetical protein, partial [Mesotoga sp.]|uniref:hypothetical protein n=1 Tax=Mesotoga sp. TaxID=2053577 RepID=UPI002610B73B